MNKEVKILGCFLSFAVLFFIIFLKPSQVFAETAFGAEMNYSYFEQDHQNENKALYDFPTSQNVPYGGLTPNPGNLDAQSFINMMQARVFDSSSIADQGAASAVVDIMLGKNSPDFGGSYQNGITYAQNNFQSWVNLVNFYDQQGAPGYSVEWNRYTAANNLPDPSDNSSISLQGNTEMPDVFFFDDSGNNFSDYMVIFHFPGNGEFILQQTCANIIGPFTAPALPPTYTISGNIFVDSNTNGIQDNGEGNYAASPSITSSGGTVTANTDGSYSISGLQTGTYTVTYGGAPSGYYMTYPANAPYSFTITVGGNCSANGVNSASCDGNGNINNLNFGINQTFSISGNVFNDLNRNGLIDTGDSNYAGAFSLSVSPNTGTIKTNNDGTYSITGLPPGSYNVSYLSLPSGYYMTSPLNGPPPSFNVNVGPNCNTNSAPGAQCQQTSGSGSGSTGTIGDTSIGSSTDTYDYNDMSGSQYTTGSSSVSVTSMSVYVATISNAPNNQYQVGIYTDNNGTPGTLVANSSSGTLTANSWNTIPITATLSPNTVYWFVYNTNGANSSSNNMHFDSSGGPSGYALNTVTFGTWPSSFGSAHTGTGTYSIYATYTTGP